MNLIVCVSDENGMMFNNRRQSQDTVLRKKLLEIIGDKKLYMNEYSKGQFTESINNIIVDENFLDVVQEEDFCFVENLNLNEYKEKINKIYICKWNRPYPFDFSFDLDLSGFLLKKSYDIKGKSHKCITIEEWENEK